MEDLLHFVKMSKYAGERFDLTQAGGGNSSVKMDNGMMLIKASGFLLSDVDYNNGYTTLEHLLVSDALNDSYFDNHQEKREREKYAAHLVNKAVVNSSLRPSIETFLHSLLYKFTLHTHPIIVNMITCQKDWKQKLTLLFGDRALYVSYKTPGIELALAMNKELSEYKINYDTDPQIVFLQNHGVIISADSTEEVYRINEEVLLLLEKNENVDLSRYKYTNQISKLINEFNDVENTLYIAYLSEDTQVNLLTKNDFNLKIHPFCPDGYVFCGINVLVMPSLNSSYIKNYLAQNLELPKVIIYNSMVFFIANNVRKAKEMEEVFKFHLMVTDIVKENVNSLDIAEIRYLGNWEAEKYRQKL
ncbi:class II aldolase/adducin family protein [Paenibacillus sp. FSL R7-0333]|uniref:class II aldolase/adducin family protein n=1 Tax=Paenibacillus sp. FSL R7-0333 TaxID=1926587 RepID=UPI00096D9C4B|nr:hypothetical protein BK146_27655 [Paenibacillus sp. FSL R7-0333]